MDRSPLGKLLPELRNRIYELTFGEREIEIDHDQYGVLILDRSTSAPHLLALTRPHDAMSSHPHRKHTAVLRLKYFPFQQSRGPRRGTPPH